MTPEVKNIFTKLGSHKIELGLLQDIQSDYDFVNKNFGNIYDKFWDDVSSAKNLQNFLKKDLEKYSKIEKDIISAKQTLKDLGLENQTKDLDSILTKLNKNKADINRALSIKF